jgi:hypothetical protein
MGDLEARSLGQRMSRRLIPEGMEHSLVWDLLTFERLMTNRVIHWIYWAGLGIVAFIAFGAVGAAIGVAVREASLRGVLLAIPVMVGGLLAAAVAGLLWRAFCEFYVAIFRISEDLHALRKAGIDPVSGKPR